jgi:hypothetical protein
MPSSTTTPAAKPRTVDPYIIAARLAKKLRDDEAEEAAEILASPQSIKERHARKRAEWLSAASEEVRELVTKMRAK